MPIFKTLILLGCSCYLRASEFQILGVRLQNDLRLKAELNRHKRDMTHHYKYPRIAKRTFNNELSRTNENNFYNDLMHANEDSFLQIVHSGTIRPEHYLNSLIPQPLAANFQSTGKSCILHNFYDTPEKLVAMDQLSNLEILSQYDNCIENKQYTHELSPPRSFHQRFGDQPTKSPIDNNMHTLMNGPYGNNIAVPKYPTPSTDDWKNLTPQKYPQTFGATPAPINPVNYSQDGKAPLLFSSLNPTNKQQFSPSPINFKTRTDELPVLYPDISNPLALFSLNIYLQPQNWHIVPLNGVKMTRRISPFLPNSSQLTIQSNTQVGLEIDPNGSVTFADGQSLPIQYETKYWDPSARYTNGFTPYAETASPPEEVSKANHDKKEVTLSLNYKSVQEVHDSSKYIPYDKAKKPVDSPTTNLRLNYPIAEVEANFSDKTANVLSSKTSKTDDERKAVLSSDNNNYALPIVEVNVPFLEAVPLQSTASQPKIFGVNNPPPSSLNAGQIINDLFTAPRIGIQTPIPAFRQPTVFIKADTLHPLQKSNATDDITVRTKFRVGDQPGQHIYQFEGDGSKKPVKLWVGAGSLGNHGHIIGSAVNDFRPGRGSSSIVHPNIYSFQYGDGGAGTRQEEGHLDRGSLVKTGHYTYSGSDGRIFRVDYVADRDGYRTTTSALPRRH